jgi:small subunit ribosomal protein S16
MSVVIRLSRHGKKGQPFYHIVTADKRAPRDGRFIEKIGTYNPRTNPPMVTLKFERAIDWIQKGAKPTDTVRSLLSKQGVFYKLHLQMGVSKGALTQEQADVKFAQYLAEKEAKIKGIISSLEASKKESYKKRLAFESAAREKRNAKRKPNEVSATPPTETLATPSAEAPAAEESSSQQQA